MAVRSELTFFARKGERLTNEELTLMIKEADLDGDNEISFEGTFRSSSYRRLDKDFSSFAPEFKKVVLTLTHFLKKI